jgi:DNA-binding HxlR family transcriptional regulator
MGAEPLPSPGGIRLKLLSPELEHRGLLERRVLASSPPSVEYRLTDLAFEIEPVMCSIAELGTKLHARAAMKAAAAAVSASAPPPAKSMGATAGA